MVSDALPTSTHATPALALAASANPSPGGASVTFTATLSGADSPTGTVAFSAGGVPLCAAAPLVGGAAVCAVNTLPMGTQAITASYGGDANNTGALAGITHTVSPVSLPLPGGGMGQQVVVGISGGPAGCVVGSLALSAATAGDNLPANATAPLGVLRFAATGCAGATLTVQMDYPAGSLAGLQPHKFGPASVGAPASTWFPHGSVAGNRLTFTVTDNGVGDGDTTTPGAITDPHAMLLFAAPPVVGAQAIPTLSEWGVLLLSALLGALGWRGRRRLGV